MIFCTVGTTDFDPLVQAVDALAPTWDEVVLFQIGHGLYEPRNGPWFRLRPTLDDIFADASLVISHAGFGTIIEVLSLGKPLVCVPNPDRYDRHQEQILRRFAAEDYLIACFDLAELPEAVALARRKAFRPYRPPVTTLHEEIAAFLREVASRRRPR
jgi:UDP-N-acetylglucosamine transferase subunit ALG13